MRALNKVNNLVVALLSLFTLSLLALQTVYRSPCCVSPFHKCTKWKEYLDNILPKLWRINIQLYKFQTCSPTKFIFSLSLMKVPSLRILFALKLPIKRPNSSLAHNNPKTMTRFAFLASNGAFN